MWYSKFDLKKREGAIVCPNCKCVNEEQIFYSLDSLHCKECDNPVLFIRTKSFIYTFDLKNAPSLFLKIYKELQLKPMNEAYTELLEVVSVFSSEDFKGDELS